MLSSNQTQSLHIFFLWKALEKQTEVNVRAIQSLDLSNEKDKLTKIEGIFLKIDEWFNSC